MSIQSDIKEAPEPMETNGPEDNDEDPLKNFHTMITELISKNHLTSTDYESLSEIAQNNPLAIEGKLNEIFRAILLREKSLNDRESYDKLMTDILDACVRLRRDKKMVSWILMALTQTLDENVEGIDCKDIYILPSKFMDEFSLSMCNLTNSQVTSILISLKYHLDSCLTKPEEGSGKESFSMSPKALSIYSGVIKQLGVGVLEGVDMFNSRWPLAGKQLFVNALVNLGKSLVKFMKLLKRKINNPDYQIVSMNLWGIIESWQILVGFIKHYSVDAMSEDNWGSIASSVESIEEILKKIEYTEETKEPLAYLKLREHKIKCISNLFDDVDDSESTSKNLDDLEEHWMMLLDKFPYVINNMDDSSLCKLSKILLDNLDAEGGKIKCSVVQDNKKLITAIIFGIFRRINGILGESDCLTKKLIHKLKSVDWWRFERHSEILISFKKILAHPQLIEIDKEALAEITKYLKVLLNLPIMYCTTEVKTITFLIILTIKKEKMGDLAMDQLCIEILSDLSENYSEDIIQYINPDFFISELSKSHVILSRLIESSLTNTSNCALLRKCIESHDDKSLSIIVQCIDKVKTKLKSTDDKELLIKLEKKLFKKILSQMNDGPVDSDQLKSLSVALKTAVALKKVDSLLVERVLSTVMTLIDEEKKENGLQHTKESYELLKMVLHFRKNLSLSPMTIRNIWGLMLSKPCPEIVPLLVETTDEKILNSSLNILKKRTIESIKKEDENLFENYFVIWNSTAKPEMGGSREKIRQSSFQGLMQFLKITEVPMSNNMKVQIVRFFINILSSRRVPERTIDLILLVVNSFMNESRAELLLCQQTLGLCSAFLKFKTGVAINNLPIIIKLYLKSISITVEDTRRNEPNHLHSLILLEIQKLATALVKLKRHIAKLSPHIIADFIGIYYGGGVVPSQVKESLDEAVGQFLSICDQHGISLLLRVLPASLQEIFKSLYDNYIKFQKFTGKV